MLLEPLPNLGSRSQSNEREIFSRNDEEDYDDSGTEQEGDSDDINTGNEEEEAEETADVEEVSDLSSLIREPSTSSTKYD